IQSGLEQRFLRDAIRSEHEFTASNKEGRVKVNYAAFTNQLHHDIDTAAITVYYDPEEQFYNDRIITQLAFTGAPFILIGRKERIHPFGISYNGGLEPVPLGDGYLYSDVGSFFERYQADINPERIVAVKTGTAVFEAFSQLNSFQLRLFALEITRNLLAETFGEAVALLRKGIGSRAGEHLVIDYAVRLLGAIILAHKGRLGADLTKPGASIEDVYQAAVKRFPAYFDQVIDGQDAHAVEAAYSRLQQVTYSSFTPDMLSELYIRAYPGREKRKQEGRYDTPLYLTRMILKNLPIETLRPENRLLLDMTCGWGSFLVAGYERMNQMSDMGGLPLWEHIIGNDKDHFTAQLAKIALLTTSLSDNWQVENQDAITLDLQGKKPSIIVGNPKFRGARETGKQATEVDPLTGKSKRLQEADKFLIRAIHLLEPGGYLGMLMPKSFSVGEASPQARKILLETCDVQEIWDLPDDIFKGQATVRPMVIFAQKRVEAGHLLDLPVRTRSSQGKNLEQKRNFDAGGIAPSQAAWGERSTKAHLPNAKVTHLITYTNILPELKWREISDGCQQIQDVAEMLAGAIIGSPGKGKKTSRSKLVPWLTNARVTLPRPFYLQYGFETVLYPDGLREPRKSKESILKGPKVLLTADIDPSWGQCTKVAI
ncbi:MAG: N-6 DNA methylase, partial [Nitrospirota bacterium]